MLRNINADSKKKVGTVDGVRTPDMSPYLHYIHPHNLSIAVPLSHAKHVPKRLALR